MELTRLLAEKNAVTPVIGIILLVAIAVILASIVGVFALGLSDETQDTSPQTRLSFDYADGDQTGEVSGCGLSDDDGSNEGKLTITHDAGDQIDEIRITLKDEDGNTAGWNDCSSVSVSEVSAGDQTVPEIDSDDTIRVVFSGENQGDDTAVIAKFEGPDA